MTLSIPTFNETQLMMVEAMGGTGFSAVEIAEVLEIEQPIFLSVFRDQNSNVYKRYRKGLLLAKLQLRQRIFKDAGYGSSPAQTLASKIIGEAEFKLSSDA